MKKFLSRISLTAIVILMLTNVYAGQSSAGAQFLAIFPGVRGASVGGAYTIGAPSAEIVYWNPAGLNSVSQKCMSVSHADYFVDINYENIALALPMGRGTLGFHGIGLFSGDIMETTIEQPDGTGNHFSVNDFAFGVSYAWSMTNKFDAGVTFKALGLTIDKVSAYGWAFDVGAIYKTGLLGNTAVSFVIKNFGNDMRYSGEGLEGLQATTENPFEEEDVKYSLISEDFSIPLSFSLGLASNIKLTEMQKLVLHFEAGNSIDQQESLKLGLEWQYADYYYIGAGHGNFESMISPKADFEDIGGNMKSWTLGGGINFGKYFSKDMWIQYSWENHKYFGGISRYGLEMAF